MFDGRVWRGPGGSEGWLGLAYEEPDRFWNWSLMLPLCWGVGVGLLEGNSDFARSPFD